MLKAILRLTLGVLVLAALLLGWNYVGVYGPARQALSQDEGAKRVTIMVYRQYGVSPNTVVFDVWNIKEDATFPDVTRALFRTSVALSDKQFERVILARHGKPRFYLKGDYFKELGITVETENPVYTLRTLPQNVYSLAGTPAYGTWTGGALGVLTKQLEDLNSFRDDWLIKP